MEINISDTLKKILSFSTEEAMRLGNRYVGTEHVLLGILRHGENKPSQLMSRLGVDSKRLRKELEETVCPEGPDPALVTDKNRHIPVNKQVDTMVKVMYLESLRAKSEQVQPEHAFLAILKNESGKAAALLNAQGVTYTGAEALLKQLEPAGENGPAEKHEDSSADPESAAASSEPRASEEGIGMFEYGGENKDNGAYKRTASANSPHEKNSQSDTPVLDNFGRDLTRAAANKLLDPVVGRERELERVVQILSRRKKNNPILIGEPGVGKSAIAEGLAQRIAEHKVPRLLKDKKVLTLDIASIVAGTKYRGQFEERMKAIISELQKHPEIIVFIDEIHTMVGAGNSAGALDASNIFKPALARGEIQCIGATTLDEFRESIEKDGALERRFQKILVEPTSVEETVEILHNIKARYEDHHLVRYSDEAIQACVELTDRYITDRVLPDKAIDALDEAGAKVHLHETGVPEEITGLEERTSELRAEMMEAIQTQSFEHAAKIRNQLAALNKELDKAQAEWKKQLSENRCTVSEDDVTQVVAMMSGVPIEKVAENEMERLLKMGDELKKKVIGQDEAIDKIVRSIRRNRTGLKDPGRPIGSFIFLGPTGVGKTYLTKMLAEYMFNSENALIRIDMSEYMEKFDVSRLIGSPPGYVGYEDGGQLTEKVRRKPYSIILFDEIEKAHPDIFNLLLQVLDDGQLTDGMGRRVDFKNAVIVMTSNLGSRQLKEFGTGIGFSTAAKEASKGELARSVIDKALKKHFAPEFLNRIDEIIVFHNLEKQDIFRIIDTEFAKLQKRMAQMGAQMELTEAAKEFLMENGWDPDLGARPLKRCMERYIEDELSEQMLRGFDPAGKNLTVDKAANEDKLTIKY